VEGAAEWPSRRGKLEIRSAIARPESGLCLRYGASDNYWIACTGFLKESAVLGKRGSGPEVAQLPACDYRTRRALTVPRLPLLNIDSNKSEHEKIIAEVEKGGCMNKTMALAAVLILCAPVIAKENPADFTLKAHIVSVLTPKDGPIQGPPLRCPPPQIGETMIQIDNVVYTAECRHKEIQAGQDYPAQLNEKNISLLFNDKAFSFRVRDKQDAK
jgi:hypothetical protein